MSGRVTGERPGDEADHRNDVLPLPCVVEERFLREEMDRLDGTWANGPPSIIAVLRPGGSGHIYLSGLETLFSAFVERAYRLGEDDASRLVGRCPTVLANAEVFATGRRHS